MPDDLNALYSSRIIELAGNIGRTERLDAPDATVTKVSRLCGSQVTVDVKMDRGAVSDYGQEVRACALGQAASAIMAQQVVGSTAKELHQVATEMRAMLKDGGPPPTGKWADLEILGPVRDYKARHASTLLVFEAVEAAVDEIEGQARPTPEAERSA